MTRTLESFPTFVVALALCLHFPANGATITLDAVSGTGTGNQFTAGGVNVGEDCAAQGGTASSAGQDNILNVPIADPSTSSGAITNVQVRVYAYVSNVRAGSGIEIRVYTGGAGYTNGTTIDITGSYAYYQYSWSTNPAGGDWTWADITNLQAGCISRRTGGAPPTFYVDHVQVVVTYTPPPVITGLNGGANVGAQQVDSSYVNMYYEVSDEVHSTVSVSAQYQVGTGAWTTITGMTGDTGTVSALSSDEDRTIYWNARPQVHNDLTLTDTDTNLTVRVIARNPDGYSDTLASNVFVFDTRVPTGLAGFSVTDSGTSTADVAWTSTAFDNHFSHYEIYYGTSRSNVENRSVSAYKWDYTNDANLADASTDSTQVLLLNYLTTYYFKIWAFDSSGNEATTGMDSTTTLTSPAPLITGWDPAYLPHAQQYSPDSVIIGYEVLDNDDTLATVTLDMRLKGEAGWDSAWTIMRNFVRGDTGGVVPDEVADRAIYYGVQSHLGVVDTTAFMRVIATDPSGNADTAETPEFAIDTKSPDFSGTLTATTINSSSVGLKWAPATETNFDYYEVWYGKVQVNVENRSGAAKWGYHPNDPNLALLATDTTTITGLTASTTYYFRIWAVDQAGNETALASTSATTEATTTMQIFGIEDNWLDGSNTATNHGSATKGGASTGREGPGGSQPTHRTVARVDFSEVPAGATILSATYYAYCYGGVNDNNQTSNCYRVLQTWGEATCTWNTPWTGAGCSNTTDDRTATTIAIQTVGNRNDWYTWDITATVQDWLSGTYSNYGMVFISTDEANTTLKEFYSAESGTNPPHCDIVYILEPPELTGVGDSTFATAVQDGPDSATVRYSVGDNSSTVTISLEYKPAGGSWTAATNNAGEIGADIDANNPSSPRTIRWCVRDQLGADVAGSYLVRVIASDGALFDTLESDTFGIDTKAPVGLANFSVTDSSSYWLQCSWDAVTEETHFHHYEIWYGSDKAKVENRTASIWDGTKNSGMNDVATTTVKVYGLSSSTKYFFKIWAVDSMGNEATVAGVDSATTLPDPVPTVTGWNQAEHVNAAQFDTADIRIGFQIIDIDDDSASVSFQYKKAAETTWSTPLTFSGHTGWIPVADSIRDTIIWDAKADLPVNTDTVYLVRVAAVDDTGFTDTTLSQSFIVDFVAPSGLAGLAAGGATARSVDLTWTAVTDETNFSYYEIWYSANQTDAQTRAGTAVKWSTSNDAALAAMSTAATTIDVLNPSTLYYFDIWAVDDFGNEATTGDANATTAATNDPVVTGLDGNPFLHAFQYDTSNVRIGYQVDDANDAAVSISAEYQLYGTGTWAALANATGKIGAGIATSPTENDTIFWDVDAHLGNVDSVYKVRVIADDGGARDTAYTDTFAVDTKAPSGLGNFRATDTLGTQITLAWDAVTERNFNHYEIWYAGIQTDAQARSGSAVEWDNTDDGALSSRSTNTTTVTGLQVDSSYYWKIWAIDNIGNEASVVDINVATKAMVTPAWSKTGQGDIQGAALGGALYLGAGASVYKLMALDPATGTVKWSYSTSAYGACNQPTFIYSGGKYRVFATSGNYVIGRRDDGSTSAQLFAPVNLGATPGTPYPSLEDTSFYVVYSGKLSKRNISDGSSIVETANISLSTGADMVVFNDEVYVGSTTGSVYKRDAHDLTPIGDLSVGAAIELPLWSDGPSIVVTPSTNKVVKLDSSMTSESWSTTIGATNTGALFGLYGGQFYAAAADSVYAITSTGTVSWARGVADTVRSGPIVSGSAVYFGVDGGLYYAVSAADGSDITNWPYSVPDGDATTAPVIDESSSKVFFATRNGEVDAFALE